ncbi:hypothetical protein CI238_08566 [Colletotrichum incanum]|uniref:Uncharacterized protein n=1 Tax=Colletotrichum incanum TaxID=1573173 RepID=A0A161W3Q3_COLIC|nr:hypothetical protein CI238_08566 [Colletotrichum incanum]
MFARGDCSRFLAMESLWAHQTFSKGDLGRFVEPSTNQPGRVEGTILHAFQSDLVKVKSSQEDVFALVISPRVKPENQSETVQDHPALLKYLSMKISTFDSIVKELFLHPAISVLVKDGSPTISRITSQDRRVYTLRLEHTLTHQTAMTVTHLPGRSDSATSIPDKTHAIILGYDDEDVKELKSRLKKCKQAIISPFTLIKAFLYVEKKRRFREVNNKITAFQGILQNYGRVPIGNEAALDNSSSGEDYDDSDGNAMNVVEKGRRKYRKGKLRNSYLRAGANDPKNLIRLYLDVCTLKNALTAWNSQLRAFRDEVEHGEFGAASQIDIDPREYLRRLMDEYDVKIDKCDLVLQGASLAFQMVQRLTPAAVVQLRLTWALKDLDADVEVLNRKRPIFRGSIHRLHYETANR